MRIYVTAYSMTSVGVPIIQSTFSLNRMPVTVSSAPLVTASAIVV